MGLTCVITCRGGSSEGKTISITCNPGEDCKCFERLCEVHVLRGINLNSDALSNLATNILEKLEMNKACKRSSMRQFLDVFKNC